MPLACIHLDTQSSKITARGRRYIAGHSQPHTWQLSLQAICGDLLRQDCEQPVEHAQGHVPKTVQALLSKTKNGLSICWCNNHHTDLCLLIAICEHSGVCLAFSFKAQTYAHFLQLEK